MPRRRNGLGPGANELLRQPSRQRLKKADNRLDHLVSREQLVFVVIGIESHEERLGSCRGLVEAPTIVDRHDSIASTSDDQQWHSDSPI